ncbi:F-box only protein 47 [Amphibalanus amphitrite]|uniref:F-box only protein 47 n=1 Tax=Amphibalanus amphitrite TaxID=1232801 RepID=A0A6A4VE26_AMPAM|nr:F-box only protein 47 [Amphibalanus amphitrite]
MMHHVFQWLDAVSLSRLALTAKSVRALVEAWLATPRAIACLVPPLPDGADLVGPPGPGLLVTFQRLGLLQKRVTCLYFTKDRLRRLWDFVNQVDARWSAAGVSVPCVVTLACYGRFLHAAIAGWEECECDKVFRALSSRCCMTQLAERVLSGPAGAAPQDEVNLRLFYSNAPGCCGRLVLLDPCRTARDRQLWTERILAGHSVHRQARLLYLLYGPRTHKELLWEETTDSIPHGAHQAAQHFAELAAALTRLAAAPGWSGAALADLLEHLVAAPAPWLAENVACLLLLAGEQVAVPLLAAQARAGRTGQVARLLGALCIMTHKFRRSQHWVLTVVRQLCQEIGSARDRGGLVRAIWDAFTCQIMDLWDLLRSHEDPDLIEEDIRLLVSAHAEFGKVVMCRALVSDGLPC